MEENTCLPINNKRYKIASLIMDEKNENVINNKKIFENLDDDTELSLLQDQLYLMNGTIEELKMIIIENANDEELVYKYRDHFTKIMIERELVIEEIDKLSK